MIHGYKSDSFNQLQLAIQKRFQGTIVSIEPCKTSTWMDVKYLRQEFVVEANFNRGWVGVSKNTADGYGDQHDWTTNTFLDAHKRILDLLAEA